MTSPFEVASAVEPLGEGRFGVLIPEGWQQGRGAFGGLVLATLLRAIERCEPDRARVVRTLTGDLVGPALAGEGEVVVTVLRRGSNQSNLRAELRQKGEVIALATAVLSTPRTAALPGFAPQPGELPPLAGTSVMGPPQAPVFSTHYEYRPTGPLAYEGGAEPVTSGWLREAAAPSVIDAPAVIALLDAWWPAFFSTALAPRPVATVSFTAEITADLRALDPAAAFFYQARTVCDHEGFQLELRELYDARGALVALNQQTVAVLK